VRFHTAATERGHGPTRIPGAAAAAQSLSAAAGVLAQVPAALRQTPQTNARSGEDGPQDVRIDVYQQSTRAIGNTMPVQDLPPYSMTADLDYRLRRQELADIVYSYLEPHDVDEADLTRFQRVRSGDAGGGRLVLQLSDARLTRESVRDIEVQADRLVDKVLREQSLADLARHAHARERLLVVDRAERADLDAINRQQDVRQATWIPRLRRLQWFGTAMDLLSSTCAFALSGTGAARWNVGAGILGTLVAGTRLLSLLGESNEGKTWLTLAVAHALGIGAAAAAVASPEETEPGEVGEYLGAMPMVLGSISVGVTVAQIVVWRHALPYLNRRDHQEATTLAARITQRAGEFPHLAEAIADGLRYDVFVRSDRRIGAAVRESDLALRPAEFTSLPRSAVSSSDSEGRDSKG